MTPKCTNGREIEVFGPYELDLFPEWTRRELLRIQPRKWIQLTNTIFARYSDPNSMVEMYCSIWGFPARPMDVS